MFEFITISNGEAIVQHLEQGHVYRFRPADYGDWSHLRLSRKEKGEGSVDDPDAHIKAAYGFAAKSLGDLDLVGDFHPV